MATSKIVAPPEAATGLDLFAASWLERWHSYGGTVTVDLATGKLGWYLPEPKGGGNDPVWQAARHTGATRELLDLLAIVPGGRDALAEHVASFPTHIGHVALVG